MNMLLHGVENPDIRYRGSLGRDHADEEEKYPLILANPPFAGSLDYESCAKDLQQIVKTKKTGLLFLALFLRLLKPGGRAAIIVPDGVLFGSSNAHKTLRKLIVEDQKLDAVISLPGGVFKPYAGVSTAILLLTKTNSGGTDHVWFYDLNADGMSLGDKRTRLLPEEKPGPKSALTAAERAKNNLPDILARWRTFGLRRHAGALKSGDMSPRSKTELARPRTAQSFCVPKADIAARGYDLSLNRLKDVVHQEANHRKPGEILEALAKLETEIQQGMKELEGMRFDLLMLNLQLAQLNAEPGDELAIELPGFTAAGGFEKFRTKARQFLQAHEDHIAIHKLRTNEPLTLPDLAELERILAESGVGTAEDLEKAKLESNGLGLFVRSLVGLEREAAKKALGVFLTGTNLRANQIEFLDEVVNHPTEHGTMEIERVADLVDHRASPGPAPARITRAAAV